MTRHAILDAALRTARYSGLSGLTIGNLASETGMSKSGLYAHFKSKQALQLATMAHNRDAFVAEAIKPALAAPRGEKRLRALVANWMDWYRHPGGCLFLSAANEFDDIPGVVHDQVISDEEDLRDTLRQIIGTLVSCGDVVADADVPQLAQEIFGILLGHNWATRVLKDPRAEAHTWTAFDRLLDSLRPSR